jgi:hypothetical protein
MGTEKPKKKKSTINWGNNVTLTYQVLEAFYSLRKQNG